LEQQKQVQSTKRVDKTVKKKSANRKLENIIVNVSTAFIFIGGVATGAWYVYSKLPF